MSDSSTKYLDQLILDSKGLVVRETMNEIKCYCGLFAFVLSVCSMDITDDSKAKLINNILDSSMKFMYRKYEANLDIYTKHASENLESGKLFESLSLLPAKMREDFEMGLAEAKHFLKTEILDILTILQIDLKLWE